MQNPIVVISEVRGSVTANANLNLRQGAPSTSADVARKVPRGTLLNVTKLVEGESVAGNAHWFGADGDIYFWSGGVDAFVASPQSANTLNVPRRPDGTISPLQDADIRNVYGDIRVEERGGGRVKLEQKWVDQNIVSLKVPSLEAIGESSIQVHAKAEKPFAQVFQEIENLALTSTILTFGGTWVPRHKGWTTKRGLSPHTWGIAIDLNVAWNGYGCVPAALGEHGGVRQLVSIFESAGFAWGGYFQPQSICDGMHFELALRD